MAVFHGVAVNFGISSSLSNATGLFQTLDHALHIENELVRDGGGQYVEKTYYGDNEEATFEYVATNTGGPSGNGAIVFPSNGGTLTVTDTQYTQVAGSTWLVEDVAVKGSNTTAKRVTVKLTRYPGITS